MEMLMKLSREFANTNLNKQKAQLHVVLHNPASKIGAGDNGIRVVDYDVFGMDYRLGSVLKKYFVLLYVSLYIIL